MNKKKLVLFMPSIEGGGVEKNFFITANFLSKKIDNLSIITTSLKSKKKLDKKIKLILPYKKFWEYSSRRTKYFICLYMLIKKILFDKKITVFAFQANLYCILVCKIFNVTIVTRSNSSPSGWSKNKLKQSIYKYFLKMADGVMVNSYEFKSQMKRYFNVNTKCIYNPLNKKEILSQSKKKTEKIFNNNKSLKIINIGRFVDQKDQMTLLKALNLIKDKINFEAVIIGKGKLKNSLLNFINSNDLKKKIKIISFKENPYNYIKQSDILILTSIYEGLPNVLLEALVLKKFIISSDCPTGPKEILLHGKGGLIFKRQNYNQLSKKIIFYNKNKILCKKLLQNSYNAINRFDYDKNLNEYFKFIKFYL